MVQLERHALVIDRIILHHLRMPLRSPFETSFGRVADRESILLAVHSEGFVGYGECVVRPRSRLRLRDVGHGLARPARFPGAGDLGPGCSGPG